VVYSTLFYYGNSATGIAANLLLQERENENSLLKNQIAQLEKYCTFVQWIKIFMNKYINPYTDFGFKKLFGAEGNKDLLADFLNQLLPENRQIAELNFRNSEQLPDMPLERKAILALSLVEAFDINCISTSGERFIVEMQKAKIHFFKDRSLFYVTFPIREQAQKGEWSFRLTPVYFIAILDFEYDEAEEQRKFRFKRTDFSESLCNRQNC